MHRSVGLHLVCAIVLAIVGPGGVTAPASGAQDPNNAAIVGHLILPSGGGGGGLKVTLWNDRNPLMTLRTDRDGAFRFYPLKAADYSVHVVDEAGRFDSVSETVTVLPGQQVPVTVYLRERDVRDVPDPVVGVSSVSELDSRAPRAARRSYDRGVSSVKAGDVANAIASFEQAIALFPEFEKAHNDLGVLFLRSGRARDAASHFEAAIRLDPLAFNPRLNLGILLIDTGEYAKAADALRQAVRMDSTRPAAHLALGIALYEAKDFDGAVTALERAVLFGQDRFVAVFYYLGATFAARGELRRAKESLTSYLKKAPDGLLADSARRIIADLDANPP